MRFFIINLITAALFMFSASTAGAIEMILAGADGQTLAPGEQVSVTMTLNTETTVGITLLSIGVLFDDTRLAYNKAASTTTSYLLYGGKGGGGYLKASTTCGGYPQTAPAGCTIRVGTTNQVNVDFVSVDLTNGTANLGTELLATLVFDVLPLAPNGQATLALTQTSPGNVVGQPGGMSTTATLTGSGSVVVPEPALAGLSLAALLTLGGLRLRARRQ